MKCLNPECDKEATPVLTFGQATTYICEYCGYYFATNIYGFASKDQIENLQGNIMDQVARTGKYKPFHLGSYLARYNIKINGESVRMYHPVKEYDEPGNKKVAFHFKEVGNNGFENSEGG